VFLFFFLQDQVLKQAQVWEAAESTQPQFTRGYAI